MHTLCMPHTSEIFTLQEISLPHALLTTTPRCAPDFTTMHRAEHINDAQIVFLVAQVFTGWECDNELMHKTSK